MKEMNIPKLSETFRGRVIPGLPKLQDDLSIPGISRKKEIPGLNAPINIKGSVDKLEQKATTKLNFKTTPINFRTDKIGWGRVNQQKGLKPFGDKDKDKLKNIFDCDPYNAKKQGYIHKVVNLVKGKGFVENEQTVPVGETGYYVEQPTPTNKFTYENVEAVTPIQTLQQESTVEQPVEVTEEQQPVWKELLYGTGVLKTTEEKILAQKIKRDEKIAKIASDTEIEKQRLQALAKQRQIEKSRLLSGTRYRGQFITGARQFGGAIRDVEQGFGAVGRDYRQLNQPVNPIMQHNRYAQLFRSSFGQIPYDVKVQQLAGIKTKSTGLPSKGLYSQPQPQPQPPQVGYTQQYGQTNISSQPSPGEVPPGYIWSEKSKRLVKYTRRPYRKRIPATYQQGY